MRRYQWSGLLETDQKTAGVDSNKPGLKKNPDGSVTIWFSPKAPAGQEANWVQTMTGKGWNVLLRLYGPLEPWLTKAGRLATSSSFSRLSKIRLQMSALGHVWTAPWQELF